MGIFDIFRKKDKCEDQLLGAPEIWEVRTDSMDQELRDGDLLALLEFLLLDVEAGNIDFLFLKSPYPMYGRSFLQAFREPEGAVHLEVGTIERLADGRRKVLGTYGLSHEEAYEVMLGFIKTGELDDSSWLIMEEVYR